MHTCKAHTSYITACDWDESSSIMRSNSGDYELLFWDAQGNQDPSGRSNYVDTKWATHTAKMAWTVEGIYPGGVDGTYVNSVCASNDENFILTGDDSRLWRVFNNPVRHGHKPRCYRGHSEFVCTVIWDKNDERVWTCGGQDMTVMQWKKC
jgi:microtubule-associated protein-like 1/2